MTAQSGSAPRLMTDATAVTTPNAAEQNLAGTSARRKRDAVPAIKLLGLLDPQRHTCS